MMKRHAIAAFLATFAIGGSALAADVAPMESSVDWSGYYVGASGTLGNVDVEFSDPWNGHIGDRLTAADSDVFSGPGLGAQIGYLHQHGNFVIGAELFGAWNNAEGCVVVRETDPTGCPYGHAIETEIGHALGVDAKIGVAAGPVLIYGLAGLSWTSVTSTYNDWSFGGDIDTYDPEADTIDTNSDMTFGLRFGGGAEVMVTERVSVFAEATYTSLDTSFLADNLTTAELGEDTGLESEIGLIQANVGLNFHF
jgi:opacity protein-like surface antigen